MIDAHDIAARARAEGERAWGWVKPRLFPTPVQGAVSLVLLLLLARLL